MSSNYTITIVNATNNDNNSPIAGDSGTPQDVPSGGGTSSGAAALKGILAIKGMVMPIADQLITHQISTVTLRTGAVEQQERLSFAYSMGKKVSGVALSTAIGAATGGGVGAAIGAMLGVANAMLSYGLQARQIDISRSVENVGLRFANIRAGGSVASFSGSRLNRQ